MTILTRPRPVRRPPEARTVRRPGLTTWLCTALFLLMILTERCLRFCRAAKESFVSRGLRLTFTAAMQHS